MNRIWTFRTIARVDEVVAGFAVERVALALVVVLGVPVAPDDVVPALALDV